MNVACLLVLNAGLREQLQRLDTQETLLLLDNGNVVLLDNDDLLDGLDLDLLDLLIIRRLVSVYQVSYSIDHDAIVRYIQTFFVPSLSSDTMGQNCKN
mgnify:CR=1 FL=1